MEIMYVARIAQRLVMTYDPILGTKYELRNVIIDEEISPNLEELINE